MINKILSSVKTRLVQQAMSENYKEILGCYLWGVLLEKQCKSEEQSVLMSSLVVHFYGTARTCCAMRMMPSHASSAVGIMSVGGSWKP